MWVCESVCELVCELVCVSWAANLSYLALDNVLFDGLKHT